MIVVLRTKIRVINNSPIYKLHAALRLQGEIIVIILDKVR